MLAGHAEAVLAVQFSPNGRYMASGSGDTTVRLWDLATGTPLHTLKVRCRYSVCGESSLIWIMLRNPPHHQTSPRLHVVTLLTAAAIVMHMQGHKNWVLTLAWSPDAKMLASGGMDGVVWLWSPEKGEPVGSCKVLHQLLLACSAP